MMDRAGDRKAQQHERCQWRINPAIEQDECKPNGDDRQNQAHQNADKTAPPSPAGVRSGPSRGKLRSPAHRQHSIGQNSALLGTAQTRVDANSI
jgi:hypothetical protein